MSKLIIQNRSDLPDASVLEIISKVISMGRISKDGKQYCYLTAFDIDGQEYHAVSSLNKESDGFLFYKKSVKTS